MGGWVSPASEVGKWLGLVTAVWVQCVSGNNYTFSNYSDALKSLMGLNQLELNNLSVAKDVGKAFGLLAGLASDRVPTYAILLIGSVEGLLGYGAQWLVVNQTVRPLPYWAMCIFLCMGGNSSTWMNTAVLVTCIRNFRRNRGPVAGILKGYVGLSTALFTDVCTALFADNPATFLFILAVVPAVVCSAAMVFMTDAGEEAAGGPTEEEQSTESKCFGFLNVAAIVIAVYLLVYDFSGEHSMIVSYLFVAILFLLLLAPLGIPGYLAIKARRVRTNDVEEPLIVSEVAVESAETTESKEEEEVVVVETVVERRKPEMGEDHSIKEALRSLDFWIMFVSFLCGVGTALTVMNNMGQIGLAMGYTDVSIFVSMISIFGFFGRIGSGTLSEYFLKKCGTPRPLWNATSQIPMAAGYVIMALALPGSLYIGSIIVGICYGFRLAITVPTASELFGLKNYGLIYNILILNLPLGSFLFSGLLAGLLYDSQATSTAGGGNTCVGAHCYMLTFFIMAIACIVGFGFDILLAFRTRTVYMKIHASKKAKN